MDKSVIVNQGSGVARPAKLSLARRFRITPASGAIPGRILVPADVCGAISSTNAEQFVSCRCIGLLPPHASNGYA
jgi:hypothetical protein